MSELRSRVERRQRKIRISTLRLVREGSCIFDSPQPTSIRNAADVFDFMRASASRERVESFWVLPLDSQHRLSVGAPIVITRGILNASLVHPREVFLSAFVANAAAIILVHNHPSGDPTPSSDDRLITQQLVAAGRLLDLPVLDHVIVGNGCYFSLAAEGLLQ